MCFPVKFVKFLRTSFFTEHLQWLLLTALNSVLPSHNRPAKPTFKDGQSEEKRAHLINFY